MLKIGLDVNGGDNAPNVVIDGALLAKNVFGNDIQIVLFGDINQIKNYFIENNLESDQFEIVHSSEKIEMGEHPTKAIGQKKNSSINIGFNYLKSGLIDGFASAGNTGAMIVGAMYSIKSIEGVIRPSLITIIPRENGKQGILLDIGANVDTKPDVLYQFALLGSIYSKTVLKINNPKVGLLNIGEEKEKGNMVSQATFELLDNNSNNINFIGNVEGRDLLTEQADVIVCDGFTGNIVLKQMEGFYSLLKKRGLLDEYFENFNYETHGGSPILGVNKPVIIGHGISNDIAIMNMLLLTAKVIKSNLCKAIKDALNDE